MTYKRSAEDLSHYLSIHSCVTTNVAQKALQSILIALYPKDDSSRAADSSGYIIIRFFIFILKFFHFHTMLPRKVMLYLDH
jgi:hypothetical protein